MSDGSSQAAKDTREAEERERRVMEGLEAAIAPVTRPTTAGLPKAGAFPETTKVDALEEYDRRAVQTAVRRAVSKAITHIGKRKPDEATERDVQVENIMLDWLIKEMSVGADYSGGKAQK